MSDKKIITYEMTGSPKESGFKTKSELIEYLKGKGYVKDDLSREGAGAVPEHVSDILISDYYSSSSNKMQKQRRWESRSRPIRISSRNLNREPSLSMFL